MAKIATILMSLFCAMNALADEKPIVELLEIYRSIPGAHDQAFIIEKNGVELLYRNSNVFLPSKLEFGRYHRTGSSLRSEIEALERSLKGGESPSNSDSTSEILGWHVRLMGKELDAADPRFVKGYDLMLKFIADKGWAPKSVSQIILNGDVITYQEGVSNSPQRKPSPKKLYSRAKACNRSLTKWDICEVGSGFIFLSKPN